MEGTQDDERELAIGARTDRAAFAALYRHYVERVFAYCYRRLGDEAAAEDATSEIFAKALAAIPRFRPEAGSFRSWLFVIAHNMVIDERRRKRPAPLIAAAERSRLPGPEQRALASDRSRVLRALLDELPRDQAQLVELRLAGLDDREIARVLGRSPGAIRVAQHRAIKRMRALFSELDEADEGLRYGNE
jgi:RNA polymerase sigma-70 factor (ECF subfamily)